MKRHWIKALLVFTVLVASLLLGGVYGILHTTTGARLLLSLVAGQLDASLELEGIAGALSSGLEIDTTDYRDMTRGPFLPSSCCKTRTTEKRPLA